MISLDFGKWIVAYSALIMTFALIHDPQTSKRDLGKSLWSGDIASDSSDV